MENKHQIPIAVIGLSASMPGAKDINHYWKLLLQRHCGITTFTPDDLLKTGVNEDDINNPNYIKRKGYLPWATDFDASAFNMSTQEATLTDPQFRLFLELIDQAIHTSGYTLQALSGQNIGIVGAAGNKSHYGALFPNTEKSVVHEFNHYIHQQASFLSMFAAHKLNFLGPAFTIQSACSSSLASVMHACELLRSGFCEMAIAGGVSLTLPLCQGYFYEKNMIYAANGECLPFSGQASGIVPADGGGVVLLKPWHKAVEDNDTIYARIEDYAMNNDGRNKLSYSAPSFLGQQQLLHSVMARTKLDPHQIRYIEAHGSGTRIGDQIEVEALRSVFTSSSCYVGSVKSNIGHTDVASGIAGLLKVILSLYYDNMPPMHNNKKIRETSPYADGCVQILDKDLIWSDEPQEQRFAGVSAFGIGGTNVHMIVKQADTGMSEQPLPTKRYAHKQAYLPPSSKQEANTRKSHPIDHPSSGANLRDVINDVAQNVFETDQIEPDVAFENYGFDSLMAIDFASELQSALGFPISPRDIIHHSTLLQLQAFLESDIVRSEKLVHLKTGDPFLPVIIFLHAGHGDITEYQRLLDTVSVPHEVYAIQNYILNDRQHKAESLSALAKRYATLIKHQFHAHKQPFILCGWSFGGTLAVELSRQLAPDFPIKSLFLFDAWARYNPRLKDKSYFKQIFSDKIANDKSLSYLNHWMELHWQRAQLLVEYDLKETIDIPCYLYKATQLETEYETIDDAHNHWQAIFDSQLEVITVDTTHSHLLKPKELGSLTAHFYQTLLYHSQEAPC